MEFKGKLAVITGGASGIGRSVALALAELGTDMVIADLDEVHLKQVCQEIEGKGRRALAVKCDVTKDTDVENMTNQTIAQMGVPDILMNNAGIGTYGNFEKIRISDYNPVFNINVLGVIRCVLAFLPHMLKRGTGYIVNTASRAGFVGSPWPYPLSKCAVLDYSEGLYLHLRPQGIMVSALCPAVVNTNLPTNAPLVADEGEIKDIESRLHEEFTGPDSLDPGDVALILVEGMKERRFLILTPHVEEIVEEALNRGRDLNKLENYLQNFYREWRREFILQHLL